MFPLTDKMYIGVTSLIPEEEEHTGKQKGFLKKKNIHETKRDFIKERLKQIIIRKIENMSL